MIDAAVPLRNPSFGASAESRIIEQRLKSMRTLMSGAVAGLADFQAVDPKPKELAEQLRAKLSAFKAMTALVAMHLNSKWRSDLFKTLGALLDPGDWDEDFVLPSEKSFSTFLRMIIYLHPTKRPGLGLAPNGRFVASWRRDRDRIVIECMDNDEVRWVLSRYVEGERESGAGQVQIHRVPDVTAAFDPECLFINGDKVVA